MSTVIPPKQYMSHMSHVSPGGGPNSETQQHPQYAHQHQYPPSQGYPHQYPPSQGYPPPQGYPHQYPPSKGYPPPQGYSPTEVEGYCGPTTCFYGMITFFTAPPLALCTFFYKCDSKEIRDGKVVKLNSCTFPIPEC